MTRFKDRLVTLARGAIALTLLGTLAVGSLARPVTAQGTDLGSLSGQIAADGSSTVGPITQAVAEEFNAQAKNVKITVDISGTGGGFKRFCAGETDVQDASRPITPEEAAVCKQNSVDYYVFEVAYDGITIVVNKANTFATCLTNDQLKRMWQKDNPAKTWADINPAFPAEEIKLYGPGTDSGTFDFFVQAILGKDPIREDFTPSEDDNVLVEGVAGDPNALGYFGFAYYENNQDKLNAVAVDPGDGNCVTPSPDTIRDRTYKPLSRPLFVYVSAKSLERPEVQEFIRFYLKNAPTLSAEVGYVASPDASYSSDTDKLEKAIAGQGQPDSKTTGTPVA